MISFRRLGRLGRLAALAAVVLAVAAAPAAAQLLGARVTLFADLASYGDFYNGRFFVNGQPAGTHRVVLGSSPSVGVGLAVRVPRTRLVLMGDITTQASTKEGANYVLSCDADGDCDQWYSDLETRHYFIGAAWQLRRSHGRGPDVFVRAGHARLHLTDVYLGGEFSEQYENRGYQVGLDVDWSINRFLAIHTRVAYSRLSADVGAFGNESSSPDGSARVTYSPYALNALTFGAGAAFRF